MQRLAIQNKNKNTYIDNQTSVTGPLVFSPSMNIGTITPNQNINIGSTTTTSVNIAGGTIQYMGTNIMNTVQADTTALSFTPTVSSASWQVITGLSCAGITTRRTTSKVRINIIIGISFCGTPATSLYFSIGKIQAGVSSYDIPSGLVGTAGATYGLTAIQSIYGYGTVSFQYITNQSSAVGSVEYFASVRKGTASTFTTNPNIGFFSSGQTGGCAQIFCEELLC